MKALDVAGTGKGQRPKPAARAAAASSSRAAVEELRRRAEINAAGDAGRAGRYRWIPKRVGWLGRTA